MHSYEFPRPAVTVDIVAIDRSTDGVRVLLIRRRNPPFKDRWALPGGFVDEHENLEAAAVRELTEETGLTGVKLHQLQAFGQPGRDPRGHTVTIAYLGLLTQSQPLSPGSDASDAAWFVADDLPALAFDHADIIALALERVAKT